MVMPRGQRVMPLFVEMAIDPRWYLRLSRWLIIGIAKFVAHAANGLYQWGMLVELPA